MQPEICETLKKMNTGRELYGKEYVQKFTEHSSFRIDRLMKRVRLNRGYHIFDFACGNGLRMSIVASQAASYIGVDFSEDFTQETNDDWMKFLVSIKNSLKTGRSLYIHTPSVLFFSEVKKSHSLFMSHHSGCVAVCSRDENAILLREAGYKIKRILLFLYYNFFKIYTFCVLPAFYRQVS